MQPSTDKAISLYDLTALIHRTIDQGLPRAYLVIAEIQSMSVNRSGHAYLDLVEKSENGEQIISQARATIWAGQFRMIKAYFETTTGRMLQPGIKIMVKVKVTYHEIYGLSLNITDILPEYTAGEILEASEGPFISVSCLADKTNKCPRAFKCQTLPLWEEFDKITHDFFYSKRLVDLLIDQQN